MSAIFISIVAVTFVSLVCFIAGGILFRSGSKHKLNSCMTGELVGFRSHGHADEMMYFPVYEYIVNDEVYTTEGFTGFSSPTISKKVGKQVTIYYDRNNPSVGSTMRIARSTFAGIILLGMGIIFGVTDGVLLLLYLGGFVC